MTIGKGKGVFMNMQIKKWIIYSMVLIFLAGLGIPMTSYAADAEWRMMHGEQDALVVGTITETTEDGYKVEVAQAVWCKQDTAKGRMIPIEDVPSEMIIPEIRYAYSYHVRTEPQIGDYLFISVDKKKGDIWEQNWLAMEVSSTDIATMEFAQPENMTNSEYAWKIFVASGGETTSFAFDGSDILYVDGEIVFDRAEYLKELQAEKESPENAEALESEKVKEVLEAEEMNIEDFEKKPEEKSEADTMLLENEASSIGIIGGADGPTAIFIGGKIGKGTIAAGVGIVAIILVAAIVIIRKVWKKK